LEGKNKVKGLFKDILHLCELALPQTVSVLPLGCPSFFLIVSSISQSFRFQRSGGFFPYYVVWQWFSMRYIKWKSDIIVKLHFETPTLPWGWSSVPCLLPPH
jgi:hypothetical protein